MATSGYTNICEPEAKFLCPYFPYHINACKEPAGAPMDNDHLITV